MMTEIAPDKKQSLLVLLDKWKEVNLEQRRSTLDQQATEITGNKDISIESRKALAENTKKFRLLNDAEKLSQFAALLKQYQEEVDKLTKSRKTAESAFLSVYKLLANAPDPVLGINAALEESEKNTIIKQLELENKKYRSQLEEFHHEFKDVRNQEVTIRRLEDQLNEYKSKSDNIVENRIKDSEKSMQEEFEKKINEEKQRNESMASMLTRAQEEMNKLQKAYDLSQTELLEYKNKESDKHSARQAEQELMMSELERTRARVIALEREREKFAAQPNATPSKLAMISPDLELEIAQKDIQISHLQERLRNNEDKLQQQLQQTQQQLTQTKEQLESEKKRKTELESIIKNSPTPQQYQEIKSKLQMFEKAFDYNPSETNSVSVEQLLKEKNRKFETQLMQMKVSLTEKEEELKLSLEKQAKLESEISKLKESNAKLEEDMLATKSLAPGSTSTTTTEGIDRDGKLPNELTALLRQENATARMTSMLQLICNQRDRFKNKLVDLHAENKDLLQQLTAKNSELENVRSDNLKLFQKIRYLQSYTGGQNNPAGHQNKDVEKAEIVEQKYSQMYEESVNPFVLFNRKEKYQREKELNAAEKVVLKGGQFFLANKVARTFLFFYSVLLHVLVFFTLYNSAHSTPQRGARP